MVNGISGVVATGVGFQQVWGLGDLSQADKEPPIKWVKINFHIRFSLTLPRRRGILLAISVRVFL